MSSPGFFILSNNFFANAREVEPSFLALEASDLWNPPPGSPL